MIDEHVGVVAVGGELDRRAEVLCVCAIRVDRLLHDRLQALRRQPQLQAAGLRTLQVENVVDQPHQALAVELGDVDQPRRLGGQRAGDTACEQAERAGDRRQRRAQLVTDGRDESRLQLLDLLARGQVADDADEQPARADAHLADAEVHRDAATVLV